MLLESLLHGDVADDVTSGIVVEQAVEADALDGSDETAGGCEGLQATAGADAYHRQCAMLFFVLTGGIVDVGQRVELVHHDVDVVTADAVRLARDAFAFIGACDGVELAAADLVLNGVEMGSYGIYTRRVANEDDAVSQKLGLQMKVET